MVRKIDIFIGLNEFINYPPGWAGEGSIPISVHVFHNALVFFSKIPKEGFFHLNEEDLYPTSNGTVSIDFIFKEINWCVEIGSDSFSSFTTDGNKFLSQIDKISTSYADVAINTEFFKYINNDTTGKD